MLHFSSKMIILYTKRLGWLILVLGSIVRFYMKDLIEIYPKEEFKIRIGDVLFYKLRTIYCLVSLVEIRRIGLIVLTQIQSKPNEFDSTGMHLGCTLTTSLQELGKEEAKCLLGDLNNWSYVGPLDKVFALRETVRC
jgi:hypothetical protein